MNDECIEIPKGLMNTHMHINAVEDFLATSPSAQHKNYGRLQQLAISTAHVAAAGGQHVRHYSATLPTLFEDCTGRCMVECDTSSDSPVYGYTQHRLRAAADFEGSTPCMTPFEATTQSMTPFEASTPCMTPSVGSTVYKIPSDDMAVQLLPYFDMVADQTSVDEASIQLIASYDRDVMHMNQFNEDEMQRMELLSVANTIKFITAIDVTASKSLVHSVPVPVPVQRVHPVSEPVPFHRMEHLTMAQRMHPVSEPVPVQRVEHLTMAQRMHPVSAQRVEHLTMAQRMHPVSSAQRVEHPVPAQRDCKRAIEAQSVVTTKYADSPKAPDAWLAMATCQQEMGSAGAARRSLESLIAKYPSAPAAETARERLKKK